MSCKYSNLIVTPDHLEFEAKEGTKFVLPLQDLFIKKETGDLSPGWDITTDRAWLSVRPVYGRGAKKVHVRVNPREVKAGKWTGTVTISSHVTVTPSDIPIHLTVKGEEPPPPPPPVYSDIAISPQALRFMAEEGALVDSKTLSLERVSSDLAAEWSASADAAWAVFNPKSGTVPRQVFVRPEIGSLRPGTYKALLYFTSPQKVEFSPNPFSIELVVNPKPEPEPEEHWLIRFLKWLLDLFKGKKLTRN